MFSVFRFTFPNDIITGHRAVGIRLPSYYDHTQCNENHRIKCTFFLSFIPGQDFYIFCLLLHLLFPLSTCFFYMVASITSPALPLNPVVIIANGWNRVRWACNRFMYVMPFMISTTRLLFIIDTRANKTRIIVKWMKKGSKKKKALKSAGTHSTKIVYKYVL